MPTIKLDRERPLKWSMRTDYRLGSLPRPPNLAQIASKDGRKAFFALCSFIWATIADDHPFDSPEEIAPYLQEQDAQLSAVKALYDAMIEGGYIKKQTETPIGSPRGPSESSS